MYWSDVLQQHIKLKITLFGKQSLDGDVIWVDVLVSILVSSFPSVRLLNILNLVDVGLSVGYEIWIDLIHKSQNALVPFVKLVYWLVVPLVWLAGLKWIGVV